MNGITTGRDPNQAVLSDCTGGRAGAPVVR
jgi:hypothetical protein